MQTTTLMSKLFQYKAWANKDLFNLIKTVPVEKHTSEMFDAIRILNHVYVVDQIFMANTQCKPHNFKAVNTTETPSISDLHALVEASDNWFITYVNSLSETDFAENIEFTFVDSSPGRMSRVEMLMHVITHGNYHRGAVGRILAQISVTPPRDTLTVFLHSASKNTF